MPPHVHGAHASGQISIRKGSVIATNVARSLLLSLIVSHANLPTFRSRHSQQQSYASSRRNLPPFAILSFNMATSTSCSGDLNKLFSNCTADMIVGWTGDLNIRGSFDILWSALFTVFLCTWTVLCINVPGPEDGFWAHTRRKGRWSLLALFGPEFLVSFVIGHYTAAKHSVRAFQSSGYRDWTLQHAHYANMGGFVLKCHDFPPFPVNSRHLHYLVEKKYVPFPSISSKEIQDKSKADSLAKSLTALQTTWFLVQCIGRAVQHLPITTLELSVLAFVFCTLPTYFFWWHKPLDITQPTVIDCKTPIAVILIEAGDDAKAPYQNTPLDFIDALSPSWSLTVMPHFNFTSRLQKRPLERLPNDRLPNIAGPYQAILCTITCIYSGIHIFGWNYKFASRIERTLWRVSSVTQLVATFLFWVIDRHHSWSRRGFYILAWRFVTSPSKWTPSRRFKCIAQCISNRTEQGGMNYKKDTDPAAGTKSTVSTASTPTSPADKVPAEPETQVDPTAVHIEMAAVVTSGTLPPEREKSCKAENRDIEALEQYDTYVVPVYEVVVMTTITSCYAIARTYLLVEVFLAFRALPVEQYADINWSSLIPHI